MTSNSSEPAIQHGEKNPGGVPLAALGVLLLGICLGAAGVFFLYPMAHDRQTRQQRTDYRHIPPQWMTYQQTAVFQCPTVGQPTCFAARSNSTFIIGTADPPTLSFFDNSGTLLWKFDLPEEPRAIVCGTPETIFTDKIVVAHPYQIVIYTRTGDKLESIGLTMHSQVISGSGIEHFRRVKLDKGADIRSLVLTSDYLFAADTGLRCFHRFTEETYDTGYTTYGNDLGISVPWRENDNLFNGFVVYASPITMTYSPHTDLLYIVNPGKHRIEVFSQDGTYKPELSWGEPSASLTGFAGCCNPIGLAVLNDGRILTVEKGVSRIKIYKPDGSLDGVVAGTDTLESIPSAWRHSQRKLESRHFAADVFPDGRIIVFDFEYGIVRIFAPIDAAKRR